MAAPPRAAIRGHGSDQGVGGHSQQQYRGGRLLRLVHGRHRRRHRARPRLCKGAGRYPQPVALLARLGVSQHHERRGLGAALLQDVIARTAAVGREIGCRGLLVHAETQQARDFYRYLIPEFEPSPTDELHLVLLIEDILRSLAS